MNLLGPPPTSSSGASGFVLASTAGMSGKPIAAFVGSTSVFFARVGYTLSGGSISCITQLRKWNRIALTDCVCGSGFDENVPGPELLLEQLGILPGLTLKPPPPPPCGLLAK